MVSFIGTNGMEDFKLLPDLNFKAAMKPVFFIFTQSIFITTMRSWLSQTGNTINTIE